MRAEKNKKNIRKTEKKILTIEYSRTVKKIELIN